MGLIELNRSLSMQRERQQRHWQFRVHHEMIASGDKIKHDGDGDSQVSRIMGCSIPDLPGLSKKIPDLPQDIWFHIHCLMSIRDAARAACLSREFLHSWRCRPNLILKSDTIGLDESECGGDFSCKIDCILRNHSGVGVKIFKLDYTGIDEFNSRHYLDRWLPIAVKPGIEELTVVLCKTKKKYDFPCSLLSDGVLNSIRYFELGYCALRPTAQHGPLKNLTSLILCSVSITGDALECLLSNSLALERLDLTHCMEIICLKIPFILQQLRGLNVFECLGLKMIESNAPNLSSFYFRGDGVKLSLGSTLQMKMLNLHRANFVHYARAELPTTMPNLEALYIGSGREVVNTPMLPTKFLYLKHLTIQLTGYPFSPSYDYFSMVSFLDASPSLETLIMDVTQRRMMHESVFANSDLRHIPERRHDYLKNVKVTGFHSAKGLVELACYILKNAVSLECLTLDTIYGDLRCYLKTSTRCYHMSEDILTEARRAIVAIETYIEDKVSSTVKFNVLEPCSRCHVRGLED